MYYRTRTYIAADWDHDKNAVDDFIIGMIIQNMVYRFQTHTI